MVQTLDTGFRVPNELRSDTEESVVGTEWHQEAIGALAGMLREVAERRGASWGVCEQVALLGLRHADGSDYDPRPDVLVLPRPLPGGHLSSIHLAAAGVPLFIAEIASDSTKSNDLEGKRAAYAAIGVPEYLVFDPVGTVLSTPLLAWRLERGAYQPWLADNQGWWHSTVLDLALQATQPFLGVRDHDGQRIEQVGEVRRRARDLKRQLDDEATHRQAAEQALQELARQRQAAEQVLQEATRYWQAAEQALQEATRQRQAAEQVLQEEARRRDLEERVAALEARLRLLSGDDQ